MIEEGRKDAVRRDDTYRRHIYTHMHTYVNVPTLSLLSILTHVLNTQKKPRNPLLTRIYLYIHEIYKYIYRRQNSICKSICVYDFT